MVDRVRLLIGFLLLAAGSAHAQLDPLERERLTGFRQVGPNQYVRVTGGVDAVRSIVASPSGVQVIDLQNFPGRAGPMQVASKSNLLMPKVRQLGMRALTGLGWGGVAVGSALALWEIADSYRVRPDDAGGLLHDVGVPPVPETQYCTPPGNNASGAISGSGGKSYLVTGPHCGPSVGAAGASFCADANADSEGWASCTIVAVEATRFRYSINTGGGFFTHGWIDVSATSVDTCPASVDPLDPQYSLPAGLPPDADGNCRQARYHWQPITETAAAEKLSSSSWSDPVKEYAVEEGLNRGAQPVPDSAESSGPATQTGTPTSTTTTNSQGTRTTTTTPTYNYNYGPTTVTVTTTTTTMSCVGASACTSETADETTTQETGDPPPEQRQLCEDFPNIAACTDLDIPGGDTLPVQTIPVSVSPDGGWGPGDGSCPGTITLSSGVTVDPFGLVCTFADGIRFIVLGFSSLIATLIFIGRVD